MIPAIPAAPDAELSPRVTARVAGVFYLLSFVTGMAALTLGRNGDPRGFVANLLATTCYVVVTLLFFALFRPAGKGLSLMAALVSLAGCAVGLMGLLHLRNIPINPLAFFGVYCLLIAWLILRSTFLPRVLGALMAIGGVGWLTFAYPPLAHRLSPYNLAPGMLGEGALTLWLLVVGLDARRWMEQAGAAGER